MHELRAVVVAAALFAGVLLPQAAPAAPIEVLKCGSAEWGASTSANTEDTTDSQQADGGSIPCGSTQTVTAPPASASGTCQTDPCSAHGEASVSVGASATVPGDGSATLSLSSQGAASASASAP